MINTIRFFLMVCAVAIAPLPLLAQQDSTGPMPAGELKGVVITAYAHDSMAAVPAAINVVTQAELGRYSNTTILPGLNATPGVHMEERSPGSYRLSIRGSSLRSPFGVRNVKLYYNGIPVSDPGGFGYLNMFGFYNVADVQVIKGPGSSLYGAGNGGVLLMSSRNVWGNAAEAGLTVGAYGLRAATVSVSQQGQTTGNMLRYEQVESDGYRAQSRMNKKVLSYDAHVQAGRNTVLSIHGLYTDLYYQTPGGLTQKEYAADPGSARPAAGAVPGAIQQRAALYQKDVLLGASVWHRFTAALQNTTTLYGLYSQVDNPNIRNYSFTKDPHAGGRTVFDYGHSDGRSVWHLSAGMEAQQAVSSVQTHVNKAGKADSLLSDDAIRSSNVLLFGQASWQYGKLILEAGLGASSYAVHVRRSGGLATQTQATSMLPITPRVAALYRLAGAHTAYVNAARGYSPPTADELAPSGSPLNTRLRAEYGWNTEAGLRGMLLHNHLHYDMSVFHYNLQNAIVVRKDSAAGDYYTNAGGTRQDGLELMLDYNLAFPGRWVPAVKLWGSCALYNFRYGNFTEGSISYSGKQLPGVAATAVAGGADVSVKKALTLSVTYYYYGATQLNDANSAQTAPYALLGAKARYTVPYKKWRLELSAGADNLLGQRYSLGNDINAAGGRYYNAAMPLNVYAGLTVHFGS